MATVPRPLSADIASTVAIGPKASQVTMRRSKASAPDAIVPSRRRGKNSGSAISSDGIRKKAWLTRELERMPEVVDQSARRQSAMLGIGERQEIVLHQPDEMRRHRHERDRGRHIRARASPGLCARRGRAG